MQRITPHTYLRMGGFTLAAAVVCLMMLFLASTPMDPLIQLATLFFYLAAIIAMAGLFHSQFTTGRKAPADETGRAPATADEPQDPATQSLADHPAGNSRPITDTPRTWVVLLTRNNQTAGAMRQILAVWNCPLEVVSSCAEASREILNRLPADALATRVMLIVDSHELEIDPIHLPALIEQEAGLARLQLVCIVDGRNAAQSQALLDAGYSALLTPPIEKPQLYHLIAAQAAPRAATANVVDLARFRQSQQRQVKKRILLADQHTADRNRLAALLQSAGHRVQPVENGEQALDALERQRFDVALVNLDLPIMNGTQVIKLHRFTTPHQQWTSFVVMTDKTTPATLRLCRELQVRACLFKPVPTDSLLEMINAAPVVAAPITETVRGLAEVIEKPSQTRFLHADLLDTRVLKALEQLDNDSGFVPDLITIFRRDSVSILQGLEQAEASGDSGRFLELANILMDNAGQLGAFALYEMCLTLQQAGRHELTATLALRLTRLRDLVDRTTQAFEHYLNVRQGQRSDRS